MSTCVLVETGEEDPVVSVATLVSGLIGDSSDKLAAECGALLEAGKPHTVLPLSGLTHLTPQEEVAENLLLVQSAFLREALGIDT